MQYRSITVRLRSLVDLYPLPEYQPLSALIPSESADPCTFLFPDGPPQTIYVPHLPSHQLWIEYHVAGPHPPRALYYFKLFINNTHIVSWGVGKDDAFRGKTAFALYAAESPPDPDSSPLRKHALFFAVTQDHHAHPDDAIEIKVYRARGRRRVNKPARLPKKSPCSTDSASTYTKDAGPTEADHPLHLFQYALLDPLSAPFATFCFKPCPSEALHSMVQVVEQPLSVYAPSTIVREDSSASMLSRRSFSAPSCSNLSVHRRAGLASPVKEAVVQQHQAGNTRRLSIPPSIRLGPSSVGAGIDGVGSRYYDQGASAVTAQRLRKAKSEEGMRGRTRQESGSWSRLQRKSAEFWRRRVSSIGAVGRGPEQEVS